MIILSNTYIETYFTKKTAHYLCILRYTYNAIYHRAATLIKLHVKSSGKGVSCFPPLHLVPTTIQVSAEGRLSTRIDF